MSIEAMKQALEDLEDFISIKNDSHGAMGYHLPWILREHITALRTAIEQAEKQERVRLWLWKNFVEGRPEYWAFDNPFPCMSVGGDPMTFGEPCGWALLKSSINGRPDRSEQEVINQVTRLNAILSAAQSQDLNGGHQLDVAGRASTATITKRSYRDCGSEGWFIAETVAAPGGLLPQQEPVAKKPCPACGGPLVECQHCEGEGYEPGTDNDVTGPALCRECGGLGGKRNTTPPAAQREWVGLTDEDIKELWDVWKDALCLDLKTWAFAIEAKLKEKNT